MRRRCTWACICALLLIGQSQAQDRLSMTGAVDLRWVHATGDTSWLNGGTGSLRFDENHEGLRLGRAFVATRLRLSDETSVHAVIETYGDHDRNPLDLGELWLEWRPFPATAVRWRTKVGAFHMPVSLENRASGWSDVYAITPAALNTWLGEEFRTIGVETEARWMGASSGYLGDFAVIGAVYGWNDPAGAVIADRGFALTDRPSTLFGGLGRPPIELYHEIDRRPGYYGGLEWRHHDRLELRALRYDNRADPGASTTAGASAWRTWFSSLGARLEPTEHWTFIAQYLDGGTVIGPDAAGADQFRMKLRTGFALASLAWGHERVTLRRDEFRTHQLSGFFGPPADEYGHATTLAAMHEFDDSWVFAAEWLRVSSRFPPRVNYGAPASALESQLQLSVRYRFRLTL